MKAAEIEVGAVYWMRWEPKLRLVKARVIERRADGTFLVEPLTVRRADDPFSGAVMPLTFTPNHFMKELP